MKDKPKSIPVIIDYCLEVLEKLGIELYRDNSQVNGYCILKEEKRLYFDSSLSDIQKFKALLEVLNQFDLDNIFINPVLRECMQRYKEKDLNNILINTDQTPYKKNKRMIPKTISLKRDSYNNEQT